MTKINYALCDEKILLEISGHACPEDGDGYRMPDPEEMELDDSSLACAAVSILVISATEALRRLENEGAFRSANVIVEQGYALFDLTADEAEIARVAEKLEPMLIGFELLEENYPNVVKFE